MSRSSRQPPYKAVDTHLHADHVTGLGALRDRTQCITAIGEQTHADVVSMRVAEWNRVVDTNLTATFLLARAAEKPLAQIS